MLVKLGAPTEEVVAAVQKELGTSPDITMECSGAESSVNLAILVSVLKSETYFFSNE